MKNRSSLTDEKLENFSVTDKDVNFNNSSRFCIQ